MSIHLCLLPVSVKRGFSPRFRIHSSIGVAGARRDEQPTFLFATARGSQLLVGLHSLRDTQCHAGRPDTEGEYAETQLCRIKVRMRTVRLINSTLDYHPTQVEAFG